MVLESFIYVQLEMVIQNDLRKGEHCSAQTFVNETSFIDFLVYDTKLRPVVSF